MTPEQFQILREDFAQATERFFGEMRGQVEQFATASQSPYRNRSTAAAYLQCSPALIDQLMASGELDRKYLGVKPLIPVKELERILEEHTRAAGARKFRKAA